MNDVVVVENAVRQGIFEVGVGDDRGWHLKDVLGYRGGARLRRWELRGL